MRNSTQEIYFLSLFIDVLCRDENFTAPDRFYDLERTAMCMDCGQCK